MISIMILHMNLKDCPRCQHNVPENNSVSCTSDIHQGIHFQPSSIICRNKVWKQQPHGDTTCSNHSHSMTSNAKKEIQLGSFRHKASTVRIFKRLHAADFIYAKQDEQRSSWDIGNSINTVLWRPLIQSVLKSCNNCLTIFFISSTHWSFRMNRSHANCWTTNKLCLLQKYCTPKYHMLIVDQIKLPQVFVYSNSEWILRI